MILVRKKTHTKQTNKTPCIEQFALLIFAVKFREIHADLSECMIILILSYHEAIV